jgi:hypothetical protein
MYRKDGHFPEKFWWEICIVRVGSPCQDGVSVQAFNPATGPVGRRRTPSAVGTIQITEAIDAEIERLQVAKTLLDGSPTSKPSAKPSPKPGGRKRGTAGRERIVPAQKARWAKVEARR